MTVDPADPNVDAATSGLTGRCTRCFDPAPDGIMVEFAGQPFTICRKCTTMTEQHDLDRHGATMIAPAGEPDRPPTLPEIRAARDALAAAVDLSPHTQGAAYLGGVVSALSWVLGEADPPISGE